MLLKSAIRFLLFRKAGEQLGLFDIPVPIKPYVRDGKVIAGHVAKRKKRIAPKGKQPDLFGVAEPKGEAVKLGRLGHFIEKHGGYGRLHAMLQGYTDDQRNTLLDSMAKLAGKTRAEVVDILANGAKHEAPEAPKGDLFDGVEAEAPISRQETQSAEHQSLIAKYRLPAATTFRQDGKFLNAGKWRAIGGDHISGYQDTPENAAQELRQWIDGSEAGKKEKARHAAATQALVGKLKSGENPSFEEWKAVFPDLKPHHTYLRQAEVSPLLIEHFGFSRNAIRAGLGRAAGYLESDTGATYPIVYFNRLAEVLGGNKDNQGRDLAAVKRTKEQEQQRAEAGRAASRAMHEATIKNVPLPDWTTVNGQEVLRSGDSKFVAVPRNGKRTAANFDVLDLDTNEYVLSLRKDEVSPWLHSSAKVEFEEKHGHPAHEAGPKEGDTKTENGIEYRLQDGRWHRTTPEKKPSNSRRAEVIRPDEGGILVNKYDNGQLIASRRHDVMSEAITDKATWEVGQSGKRTSEDTYRDQFALDDFARRGYQAAQSDKPNLPPEGSEQEVLAWKIGYRRGREERGTSAGLEKPAFTPTHELPDGTQVIAHADEANVWVDAQGDEYESEEAYPLSPQDPVRDTAREKLDTAKEAGVITPDEHQAASEALDSEGPAAAKAAIDRKRKADKLRKVAQNLMDKAQATQNQDRNTNTARRASMAQNILARAAREEATARTMLNLADAIEAGEAPHLEGMNSMAAVQTLDAVLQRARSKYEEVHGWTYDRSKRESGRPWGEDDIRFVMWPDTTIRKDWIPSLQGDLRQARGGKALADEVRHGNLTQDLYDRMVKVLGEHKVNGHVGWYAADRLKDIARLKRAGITGTEDLQAAVREYVQFKAGRKAIDPVKAAEMALAGQKVGIDFFPTPKALADRMAELADIEPGMKVLEPSAGKGNLADAAKARGADVDVVEVSDALRNVLQAKGYALVDRDFNDFEPGEVYDRIIMNPPFGKGTDRQDAAHIQRAYQMLKPGGKLVAIAGEGVFIGSDQKAAAFRDWLNQRGAMIEKLPDNSFMDRAETHVTGAATRLVVIEKPAAAKQDDDAHTRIADKAIESVNTLIMARKEQTRGADMHTLPYVNAVRKAIEFLERKGDTQNAQRIRDAIAQGEKEAGRSLLDDDDQIRSTPKPSSPDVSQSGAAFEYDLGQKMQDTFGTAKAHAVTMNAVPVRTGETVLSSFITVKSQGKQRKAYRVSVIEGADGRHTLIEKESESYGNFDNLKVAFRAIKDDDTLPRAERDMVNRLSAQAFGQQQDDGGGLFDMDDGPQEGERNAEGLVFHDGRWHREDDPEARTAAIDDQLDAEEAQRLNPPETTPEPTPEPSRPDPLERLRAQIEAMGGKAQVAENLRMAFKDRLTRPQAEAVINELADATGLDRDTVLAEMGIKEVVRKPADSRTRPDTLSTGGEYTDDDPNSPNYRFRDTGYIGDSRKELAAESIREHARNGQRLRATDIDWQQIEQNPRQAKELITKSNLFGKVDWEALKANGMGPATGFLIDRVYASIAPEPSADDAQARKDYAVGLETLRDRLESCKTPENVTEVLEELRDEYDGIIFNEREKAAYESAREIYQEISNRRWALKQELDALQQAAHRINGRISGMAWEQEKRERRKWKRDPDIDRQIEELRPAQEAAIQAVQDWKDAHPEAEERYETQTGTDAQGNMHVRSRLTGELYQKEQAAYEVMQTIKAFSLSRNREENPLHRAWRLMGPKFLTVLKWRSGKNAFQGHVTSAKTGKIKDWSWAEKQHVTAPRSTEGKVRFQLRVAENFSRVGGRPVEVNSTDELKRRFGLRDVQSGNWVLTDPESAAFHVQHAAEALSDLSDLLGIPEDKLFVNGRVALAFGARGTGNAGFGGAARAHYERIHRVINLTKMGGGGALAHELFHAIDNLAKEAETGQPGDAEDFITDNPDLLPDGPLKQAVRGLRSAMLDGDKRLWQTLKYTANDARLAKHNLDRAAPSKMAAAIKDAADLESALLAIDGFYPNGWISKRTEKHREEWRRIAAAWHDGMKPEGGKALARAGAPVSDFTYQAHLLDGGQYGKYWSTTREMAARAFQAWCEDRLSDQGRKNDYLSAFADNQYYKDPIFGDSKPFPEGRERERINAAIDDLVYALRQSGTLQKAFELLAA